MSELLCCHNVNVLGIIILLVVAAVCLYWNDKNMRAK